MSTYLSIYLLPTHPPTHLPSVDEVAASSQSYVPPPPLSVVTSNVVSPPGSPIDLQRRGVGGWVGGWVGRWVGGWV